MSERRRIHVAFGVAALLAAVALPWLGLSSRALTVATQIAINAMFAASFHLMFGLAGMLWFAHAVFFGVAGYTTAYLLNGMASGAVPYFPVSLLPAAGGLAAAALGVVLGAIVGRREKLALAMISLAVSELMIGLGYVFRSISGGEEGVSTDRWVGPDPFGITFGPQREVYLLSLVWCALGVLAIAFVARTPLGYAARALRENSGRAPSLGYDPYRIRVAVFGLSAFFAGVAGSLFALNYEHVGLSLMSLEQSAIPLFSVVIGGLGFLTGALVGSVAITLLQSSLADFTPAWLLYLGLAFTLIVLFARDGVAAVWELHRPLRDRAGGVRSLIPTYAVASLALTICAIGGIGAIEVMFAHRARMGSASILTFGLPVAGAFAIWSSVFLAGAFWSARALGHAALALGSALRATGLSAGAEDARDG